MRDEKVSVCDATLQMVEKSHEEGIETVWDRYQKQLPQCNYGMLGICCRNCTMGPCRIDPFGNGPQTGVCGATADVIVARNLLTQIATGTAAHSDHGRALAILFLNIVNKKAPSFYMSDSKKVLYLAIEMGIPVENRSIEKIAVTVGTKLLEDFGRQNAHGGLHFFNRAPEKRVEIWKRLNLLPRGIDREVVESMHRTHIGVDNDAASLLFQGIRTALADGWAGSMIATELSDVIYGTPTPVKTRVNLGVLKEDMVNIIVHGHELMISEMIVQAANDRRLLGRAEGVGAKGINVCGMCCSGIEILSRHGVPLVGNFLQQEFAIITGAVEAMVVDVQCILPSLVPLSKCYHTQFITTSSIAHFTGAMHLEFKESNAWETASKIVEIAVDNFKRRKREQVCIPQHSMETIGGFSTESIIGAFGGTLTPLVNAIECGQIRGIAGVVGCNNPKIRHDHGHLTLVRELIRNNILVVSTGCNAIACAKDGLLKTDAAEIAGDGLKSLCREIGIPPVLHMGSCVDNSRILTFIGALAKKLNCDISDLPVAGGAPEWMSQKAVSIATYLVGSGVSTVLGVVPPVLGSANVAELLLNKIEGFVGAKFSVEPDPLKAACLMIEHIEKKRSALFSDLKILEMETITSRRQDEDELLFTND
ncbi:MAG: anaerobic carbon-monoxide dehydrogenase catalytic subunit [Chitinispirillaceae bacterium]|nr:anaerobic carbon-monoxide dehydrogenase catalytic subunit [Chitinispirillaceae bacterium]